MRELHDWRVAYAEQTADGWRNRKATIRFKESLLEAYTAFADKHRGKAVHVWKVAVVNHRPLVIDMTAKGGAK
jgi:hypothetical protein